MQKEEVLPAALCDKSATGLSAIDAIVLRLIECHQ